MRTKGLCALLLALGLLLGGCAGQAEQTGLLQVSFLKVGKADAIVLSVDGRTMVVDTGERDDGKDLLRFLRAAGAERVDCLQITHFDRDHVGGAARLVDELPVERVLLPAYESELEEYRELLDALERKGIEPERVTETLRFSLGGAEILVEPPDYDGERDGDFDNELSLITTVQYGENRIVLAGDSEKRRIGQWLDRGDPGPCDLLKVPHHGVYGGGLRELFSTLSPRYAVICSSDKNPAEKKTLELLEQLGVSVWETRYGTVTVSCDGKTLDVRQDRS